MWSVFTSETLFVRALAVFLVSGAIGVGLAEGLREANRREKDVHGETQEPKKPPAPPPVTQSSEGDKSPNTNINGNQNVVGNNITVTYGKASDKDIAEIKADVKKLLEALGDKATPANLSKQYPPGYAIFEANLTSKTLTIPYKNHLTEQWEVFWDSAKIAQQPDGTFILTLPTMREKTYDVKVSGNKIILPKDFGPTEPQSWSEFNNSVFKWQILARDKEHVVVLFGLTPKQAH